MQTASRVQKACNQRVYSQSIPKKYLICLRKNHIDKLEEKKNFGIDEQKIFFGIAINKSIKNAKSLGIILLLDFHGN